MLNIAVNGNVMGSITFLITLMLKSLLSVDVLCLHVLTIPMTSSSVVGLLPSTADRVAISGRSVERLSRARVVFTVGFTYCSYHIRSPFVKV